MPIDGLSPVFLEPNATQSQPDLLVSAVLYLMSHYAANVHETGVCLKLAAIIERHLQALAELPDLTPVLRATCQQLSEQWATVAKRAMPRMEKTNLFTRLVSGMRVD